MKSTVFLFLLFFGHIAYSQTEEKQKAHELCLKGIGEMDKGEIEKALDYFEQAKVLDQNNFFYPYEIAHANYLTHHYAKAIQILEPLITNSDATDHAYHLLGSSYENSKNVTKALSTYVVGLEKFPKSGILYYGLGNLFLKKRAYKQALDYFEKGIAADPDFSQNYYWASKVHASLQDKLWGIIYAELYINMAGVNDYSKELGKMIFNVYEQGINLYPNGADISLMDADSTHKKFESDFGKVFAKSAASIKEINISTLSELRESFIMEWIETGKKDLYPNLLFDWHTTLLFKGYWEPYHYWLLKEGNPEEYQSWLADHQTIYNEFVDWLSNNYIVPSSSNYFVTGNLPVEQ